MTFDEVFSWCWYLDALEEAEFIASKRPEDRDSPRELTEGGDE